MENKKYEVYRGNSLTLKKKTIEVSKVLDKSKWRYPEWH